MSIASRLDAEARRRSDTTLYHEPLSSERRIPPVELDKMKYEIALETSINVKIRNNRNHPDWIAYI